MLVNSFNLIFELERCADFHISAFQRVCTVLREMSEQTSGCDTVWSATPHPLAMAFGPRRSKIMRSHYAVFPSISDFKKSYNYVKSY